MKLYIFIIISVFFVSCTDTVKKDVEVKKQSSNISFKTKIHLTDNEFVKKIKLIPIEKLPYEFIKCDTDTLSNLEQAKPLYKVLQIKTDSLIQIQTKADTLFYQLNKKKIYSETELYMPKYYYFILDYDKDILITFSDPFIYKRLQPISNDIEVLLMLTKIFDNDFGRQNVRGIQIDAISYNTKLGKSINRKRLITTGIGLEDITYYECFLINKDYNIVTKSFMHLEDESTSIIRKLKISLDGKIEVLQQKVNTID